MRSTRSRGGADAGAEAVLRVLAAVEAERRGGVAALVARARQIAFDAEDELVDLVLIADETAADDAGGVVADGVAACCP